MDPHPPTGRTEPTRVTLGDLVALIVGVAVAAALPWEYRPDLLQFGRGWSNPWNYSLALSIVAEGLGKACLALVPVALARCAQYARVVRPGEFLVACAGLPWLGSGLDLLVFLRWAARRLGSAPAMTAIPAELHGRWVEQVMWPRRWMMLSIAAAAGVLLVAGRRRLPAWSASLQLMLAWLGIHDGLPGLGHWVIAVSVYPFSDSNSFYLATAIDYAVVNLPCLLLYAVPLIAAYRSTGPRPALIERLEMILAGLAFAVEVAIRVLVDFLGEDRGMFWASFLLKIGTGSGAIALGVVLVRLLAPAWNRAFDRGYDGTRPASPPTEA